MLDFEWQVSIGGQKVTFAELRALAAVKAPLVKFRGEWVQMSAEEIQAALDYWNKKGARQITAREAVSLSLGAAKPPGPIEFAGVTAEGWPPISSGNSKAARRSRNSCRPRASRPPCARTSCAATPGSAAEVRDRGATDDPDGPTGPGTAYWPEVGRLLVASYQSLKSAVEPAEPVGPGYRSPGRRPRIHHAVGNAAPASTSLMRSGTMNGASPTERAWPRSYRAAAISHGTPIA